ncbi:hypothetical protein MKEN_00707600 [Mycena kentingensis (nom. inval.)]|nr:hypothetical protein MKEN_00707600 [Mycena kentingensis (nom. inval.)]
MSAATSTAATTSTAHRQNVSRQSKFKDRKNSPVDNALDAGRTALAALVGGATFTPVPFLQEAANCALGMVVTIQTAKSHKEAFKQLASDACELVWILAIMNEEFAKEGKPMSPMMNRCVRQLHQQLAEISEFAETGAATSVLKALFRTHTMKEQIQHHRDALKHALDKFQLEASISIHEHLMQMLEQLREEKSDLLMAKVAEAQQERNDSPSSSKSSSSGHNFSNIFKAPVHAGGNVTVTTINGGSYHTSYAAPRFNIQNSFNGHRSY